MSAARLVTICHVAWCLLIVGGLLGNYVLIYYKQDWCLSIVNSDGCRVHGTYWDRIISGCRDLI
jgi:hypothetical protein